MEYSIVLMDDSNQLFRRKATQSNVLVRAKYSYTKRELKLSRLIISIIKPEDENRGMVEIDKADLIRFLVPSGAKQGSINKDIKEIVQSLNSKPIEIKTDDGEATIYWIGSHGVNYTTGKYWFEIPKGMQPLLFALKGNFTSIPLYIYDLFRSPYPARMFEILCSFRHIRGKAIVYNKWQELQKQIGGNHTEYSNFKHRILKKCQTLLEENTTLRFEFEEIKEKGKRKVIGLKLWVYYNKPTMVDENKEEVTALFPVFDAPYDSDQDLIHVITQTLLGWGINKLKIQSYINDPFSLIKNETLRQETITQFGGNKLDFIWDKIQYTVKSPTVKEEAPFFISAMKNNYKNQERTVKKEAKKKMVEYEQKEQRKIDLERELKMLSDNYYQLFNEIMDKILEEDNQYYKEVTDRVKPKKVACYNPNISLDENMGPNKFFRNFVLGQVMKEKQDFFKQLKTEFDNKKATIEKEIKTVTLKMYE